MMGNIPGPEYCPTRGTWTKDDDTWPGPNVTPSVVIYETTAASGDTATTAVRISSMVYMASEDAYAAALDPVWPDHTPGGKRLWNPNHRGYTPAPANRPSAYSPPPRPQPRKPRRFGYWAGPRLRRVNRAIAKKPITNGGRP